MRGMFRAALVLPVVMVLLLSGCGDNQVKVDNAYVSATDRAVQAFETEFQHLQTNLTSGSTPAEDRKTLATLRASVDRVVADLKQIKPPAKIAALHPQLIREVQAYRTVIQQAEQGLTSDDPRRIIAARARFPAMLAAVATKITTTINAINQQLQ
ncbi:MAG: hypothetical protein JWO02_490 [Solirubrobacterales bacterium]|nr:hypothetical protein [Solirubrobacterales bacterium]